MLEGIVLLAFIAALAGCVFTGASVLWALAGGYLIFCAYGLIRKHSLAELGKMSLSGVKTVRNILMIFGLIGFITALWRASGTIAVIVCWSSKLVSPSAFLVIAFLLNCMVSILTGTSFGTGATMGVICMAMGHTMELDPFWIGGAILSGIYFGDRCSPVSSSANLVCVLTKTDIYENIREMIKTSLVPFVATCILYYIVGRSMSAGNGRMDVEGLFSNRFVLHWSAVIPAAIILVLSVFRVEVKKTMLISIVLAAFLSVVLQGRTIEEILQMRLTGNQANDPAELLESGMAQDPGTARDFLGRIKKEAMRMTNLVDDILMISRLESRGAKADIVTIRTVELLEDSLSSIAAQAASRGITVHKECENFTIRADLRQMQELFNNLLTNAVKYNNEGGEIWVQVKHWGADMILTVRDTGVGIPAESQSRIFERFYRVDKGRSRKQGGTGLGLSIVKHIVNFYHGSVKVESEVGKGSTFTVKLQIAEAK